MSEAALRHPPALDPGFEPAAIWNREYRARLREVGGARPLGFAFEQEGGTGSRFVTEVFPHEGPYRALNERYVERLFKFLLWQRGGRRVEISGPPELAAALARIYHPKGERAFDHEFIGQQVYRQPLEITAGKADAELVEPSIRLGRNVDGCRVGFDLGGTGRKGAALIDGRVVHSEWLPWDPCFATDPQYHRAAIEDTLRRAAAKLPRVDAIGGSAAGVYVGNEVRAASLFRSVPPADFEREIRRMFIDLAREWDGVPFEIANDGEVAALAGSMALGVDSLLGISLGTSQAAGYVDAGGGILPWLNELAFAPVDYRPDAPVDPWSGDRGCGVQYFSQQAVGRLLADDDPATDAQRLAQAQALVAAGEPRGRAIYETLGAYLGYTLAHYAEFYDLQHVLLTGGVTSGEGGWMMADKARLVLQDEFPLLAERITLHLADETEKSQGQAAAAATLPKLRASSI